MPRLLLGEDSARDIDEVLRREFNQPVTVRDLRKKVNELTHKTHNDNALNNWAAHHPLGQAAVAQNLLARIKGKTKPSWWREGMPVADHHIATATEVVVLRQSGVDAAFDEAVAAGQHQLREIAPRLAVGKQHLVTQTADSFELCTERFMHADEVNRLKDELLASQREVIDSLKRERGREVPRVTTTRRRLDGDETTTRRRLDGDEVHRIDNEEAPIH